MPPATINSSRKHMPAALISGYIRTCTPQTAKLGGRFELEAKEEVKLSSENQRQKHDSSFLFSHSFKMIFQTVVHVANKQYWLNDKKSAVHSGTIDSCL